MTLPANPPSTSASATGPAVCVLAGAAFQLGGMERLSWEVRGALARALGPDRVAMASLVGPVESDDERAAALAYAGGFPLTLRAKVDFAGWVIRRSLTWRSSTLLLCMLVNQAQLAWGAGMLGGSRYVVWAHGGEVWSKMETLPRLALRRADLVLCSSEFTRQQVVQHRGVDPAKTWTLHPPVSEVFLRRASLVSRSPRMTPPVILSVGRVSRGYEYKGFDQVVRALPRIAAAVPEVRYVIVGGGDALPDLAKLAAELGVGDKLELRGSLPDDEMWEAFEEARVFALPSRMDQTGHTRAGEGFGIVYAEAAAFARPVVGSIMGGAAEAVEDGVTGRNVDPTSPEAVADALLGYLESPERAGRDGDAGRNRALRLFSPGRFQANLLAVLRETRLLPEDSSPPVEGTGPDA
jgi:glycosyltransferase involved in cell wall biosynthesis